MIRAGRVSVNGAVVRDPARRVDPRRDRILVDGAPLGAPPTAASAVVLALHKPRGPLVTRSDPEGRPTVFDLLPRDRGLLRCVGRLDGASEGLLLATTDTALAAALEDPGAGVERVYRVKVRPRVDAAALAAILAGTVVDGRRAAPRSAAEESRGPRSSWLRVVLAEGRNREVRRLCAAAGREVERLVRVGYGPVVLGDLAPGAWRELGPGEAAALRAAAAGAVRGPRPSGTSPRRSSR
jgi:23S rRNA pseudouridine2605 synthase